MQWILIFLHVPLVVSLILIVAGGIDPDSRDGPTFAATEPTKAGISLYCACFVILLWATIVITSRLYLATESEVKILTTVVMSLPFFVVDIVYMMCFAFEGLWGSQRFNVISGKVTLQLCMQVIMEYIIVGLYLGLGLELPDKAARLKERAVDMAAMDTDELAGMFLWKIYEAISGKTESQVPIYQANLFQSYRRSHSHAGAQICTLAPWEVTPLITSGLLHGRHCCYDADKHSPFFLTSKVDKTPAV